jgi:hypothetical protein
MPERSKQRSISVHRKKVAILALFSSPHDVCGSKKRGFCRLLRRVATPEQSVWFTQYRLLATRNLYAPSLELLVDAGERPSADDAQEHRENRNRAVIELRVERVRRRLRE